MHKYLLLLFFFINAFSVHAQNTAPKSKICIGGSVLFEIKGPFKGDKLDGEYGIGFQPEIFYSRVFTDKIGATIGTGITLFREQTIATATGDQKVQNRSWANLRITAGYRMIDGRRTQLALGVSTGPYLMQRKVTMGSDHSTSTTVLFSYGAGINGWINSTLILYKFEKIGRAYFHTVGMEFPVKTF